MEVYYSSIEDLIAAVLKILPEATFGDDNEGQIIIYTNLRLSDGTTTTPAGELEPLPNEIV